MTLSLCNALFLQQSISETRSLIKVNVVQRIFLIPHLKKKINHLLILSTGIIISFSFPFFFFFLICLFFKERYVKKTNLSLVKKYFKQKDYHKAGRQGREGTTAVRGTSDHKVCKCLKSQAKRVFLLQRGGHKAEKNQVWGSGMKGWLDRLRECFTLRPAYFQEAGSG